MIMEQANVIVFRKNSPTINSTETTRAVRSVDTAITYTFITPEMKKEMNMQEDDVVQRIMFWQLPPYAVPISASRRNITTHRAVATVYRYGDVYL